MLVDILRYEKRTQNVVRELDKIKGTWTVYRSKLTIVFVGKDCRLNVRLYKLFLSLLSSS